MRTFDLPMFLRVGLIGGAATIGAAWLLAQQTPISRHTTRLSVPSLGVLLPEKP